MDKELKLVLKQCQNGNLTALQDFHIKNPEIPLDALKYDASGDTILHHAAKLGHVSMVTYLLDHFSPNCRNKDNKTPLHEACQFGQVAVAKILLGSGADVDALKKADWTPLMLACTKIQRAENSLQLIKLLVDNMAQVNFQNKDGWTTLHLIVREGSLDILKYLIENDVDLSKRTNNGNTALHIAALHGHIDIFKCLVNLDKRGIHNVNNQGNLPLHESVLSKDLEMFKVAVSYYNDPVEIQTLNKSGFNAMHLAAYIGSLDILAYTIDTLKFNVHQVTCNEQQTCLHLTARNAQWKVYEYCVNAGIDEGVKDKFGRTPKDYNIK